MSVNALLIGRYVNLLDKGYVQLVDMMPSPASGLRSADLAVIANARASFIEESKGEVADKKLLAYMIRERHSTPFESVVFKFRIKAPLVVWWQWVRHRTQSYNLQSGRYVEFDENEFYVPEVWRRQSSSNKQGSDGEITESDSEILKMLLEEFYNEGFAHYKTALKMGASKELARLFLPGFSVYYTGITTVNAKNLMDFLTLRMEKHAQEEIRVYADAIYHEFFKPLMPWTAELFEEYRLKPLGIIV